jgi:hypothetical protein
MATGLELSIFNVRHKGWIIDELSLVEETTHNEYQPSISMETSIDSAKYPIEENSLEASTLLPDCPPSVVATGIKEQVLAEFSEFMAIEIISTGWLS